MDICQRLRMLWAGLLRHMGQRNLAASDEDSRTTGRGLARYAREFFDAALAADDKMGVRRPFLRDAPMPVLFLTAHSIELALKAYLRHAGYTVRETRSLGHDLHRCWRVAKKKGLEQHLSLTDEETKLLKLVSKLHMSTELRYIRTGAKELPVYGPLQELTQKILNCICPLVGYR